MPFLKKEGCEFKVFCTGWGGPRCESQENLDLGAKVRGVNSVSSEKLHEFEIIYPKRGCEHRPPPCPVNVPGHAVSFAFFSFKEKIQINTKKAMEKVVQ